MAEITAPATEYPLPDAKQSTRRTGYEDEGGKPVDQLFEGGKPWQCAAVGVDLDFRIGEDLKLDEHPEYHGGLLWSEWFRGVVVKAKIRFRLPGKGFFRDAAAGLRRAIRQEVRQTISVPPGYPSTMLGSVLSGFGRPNAIRLALAGVLALVLCLVIGLLGAYQARADLAPFDGAMTFPMIQDPSGPEDYSWEVQLADNQVLEQIDDQTAVVYYIRDHTTAFGITAEPAHDAIGTKVPTTLSVSGGDVVTLTVHHRAGNPKAGGALFDYPIVAGEGWEGGFSTVYVVGPPDEAELRELRERQEREAEEAGRPKAAATGCVVPRLKGRSLGASRRRLAKAGCKLGSVTRGKKGGFAKAARVMSQSPRPGVVLSEPSAVDLKLD